jgi:serine/threonine protein kinase
MQLGTTFRTCFVDAAQRDRFLEIIKGYLPRLSQRRADFDEIERRASTCAAIEGLLAAADCAAEWRVDSMLGAGNYGMTFAVRSRRDGRPAALKISRIDIDEDGGRREYETMRAFSVLGLAPDAIGQCRIQVDPIPGDDDLSVVVMGRIRGNLRSLFTTIQQHTESAQRKLVTYAIQRQSDIIDLLTRKGYTHGDMHDQNVGYVANDADPGAIEIRLIDFGRARVDVGCPYLDVMQMSVFITGPARLHVPQSTPSRARS